MWSSQDGFCLTGRVMRRSPTDSPSNTKRGTQRASIAGWNEGALLKLANRQDTVAVGHFRHTGKPMHEAGPAIWAYLVILGQLVRI